MTTVFNCSLCRTVTRRVLARVASPPQGAHLLMAAYGSLPPSDFRLPTGLRQNGESEISSRALIEVEPEHCPLRRFTPPFPLVEEGIPNGGRVFVQMQSNNFTI